MQRFWIVLFALAVMFSSSAEASLPEKDLLVLDLKKTVNTALNHNLSIKIANKRVEQQKATAQGTWGLFLPDVYFEYDWNRHKDSVQDGVALFGGDPYNKYQANFHFFQPLLSGGELWNTHQVQRSEQKIAEHDLRIESRQELHAITVSFYKILLAQEKIKTLQRQFDAQTKLIRQARQRFRMGAERELTVLQFETQSALLKPKLIEAQSHLQIEAVHFLNLIGLSGVKNIQVLGTLEEVLAFRPLPLNASLVQRLPEVQRAQEKVNSFDAQRAILMSEHWPSAGLSADYGQRAFTKSDLFLPESRVWNYGLTLKIPLFSGLDSFSKRKELAAKLSVQKLEEQKIRNQISIEMVQVEKQFQTSLELIEANKRAFDFAQRSYQKASEMFRIGTLGYRDFFDIEREHIASELTYFESLSHHVSVVMNYHIKAGGDLVELLQSEFKLEPSA